MNNRFLTVELYPKYRYTNRDVVITIPLLSTDGGFPIETAAAGAALVWIFDLPISTMIIATSPGGQAEMTILAPASYQRPVGRCFHLFRVVVVNMRSQYSISARPGCGD